MLCQNDLSGTELIGVVRRLLPWGWLNSGKRQNSPFYKRLVQGPNELLPQIVTYMLLKELGLRFRETIQVVDIIMGPRPQVNH